MYKFKFHFFIFCALLWLLSFPPGVFAAGETNHDKTLTVTHVDSTTVLTPNTGAWDFGKIDPIEYDDGSGYSVSHEFTLLNNNKEAVVVSEIRGSNFRVQYNLPILQQSLPVTVPSDGLITIKISYHLLPLVPGNLNGSAMVFIQNQTTPAATLQFTGFVKDVVTFDPTVLDFGTVKPGQIISKALKVTYDPHMFTGTMPLPSEQFPHIAGDAPFITVKQTKIGFTTRAQMLIDLDDNQVYGPGYNKDYDRFNKAHNRMVEEERRLFETLPPINNIVTCLVTVKAPTAVGSFRGFVVIIPIDGTPGTEVLKQESVVVQGEVAAN